jgi:hypothetical protein
VKGRLPAVAALLALGFGALGVAWWSGRERGRTGAPAGPPGGGAAPPPREPPREPPGEPPREPPDEPPKDPPNDPSADDGKPRAGWRFGEDWRALRARAPSHLNAYCGACHAVPSPTVTTRADWTRVLNLMRPLMEAKRLPVPSAAETAELMNFYLANAPAKFLELPEGEAPAAIELRGAEVGNPRGGAPRVTNVGIADLDRDGRPDLTVCDDATSTVSWVRNAPDGWKEASLATLTAPAHAAAADADGDGDLDVFVAGLGSLHPTDALTGYVTLLVNEGEKGFRREDLIRDQPRMADVEPADFDGDGDLDLAAGAFGWRLTGYVAWMRKDPGGYELVPLAERSGTIHVPPADIDGDGDMDFVAVQAQDAERVMAYLNDGRGNFTEKKLFDAENPLFGLSGIELTDLDRDGDLDILASNGDALDDPEGRPKPYHGVQWLENTGDLAFEWREIGRAYGVYRAVSADVDGDGDLDVAAAVMFGNWRNSKARGLIWFENDGKLRWTRHDVERSPDHLITLAAGDLDGDGATELVAGRMMLAADGSAGNGVSRWTRSEK